MFSEVSVSAAELGPALLLHGTPLALDAGRTLVKYLAELLLRNLSMFTALPSLDTISQHEKGKRIDPVIMEAAVQQVLSRGADSFDDVLKDNGIVPTNALRILQVGVLNMVWKQNAANQHLGPHNTPHV